jgi:hypothetical protein
MISKIDRTDHSPIAAKRTARPFTTAIVLHRFAADSDRDGVTTVDEAIAFFTQDPEGIATVALAGTYAEKLPTIERWRRDGVPAAYQRRGYVPYHFLVDTYGGVWRTLPLDVRGAHAGNWNNRSVGIACLGNFDRHLMPPEQVESTAALVADVLAVYPRATVLTHDDTLRADGLPVKSCAGRHFPLAVIKQLAWEIRRRGRA